jgi:CheY-like chemotaxis protein
LPDIEGWRVLDRLKNDVTTRHIPVCVISTEEARDRALSGGAMAFVAKPLKTKEEVDSVVRGLKGYVTRETKNILVVEADPLKLDRIRSCVEVGNVRVTPAASAAQALATLENEMVDCLILGPDVPDLTPVVLEEQIRRPPGVGHLPVIVYGDGRAFRDEGDGWKKLAESFTVRQVYSPERLLDQAVLFLHAKVADLPDPKRRLLEGLHRSDRVLPGKKVLVVDDDMRNIFALSAVLEEQDMNVLSADNGRDAISILKGQPDVDVVLMDIMMPEMDGIDTMREIRKIPELKSVPIIAVTAKAMKGDREKCIEAGAWDYLSKPVDTEQLFAVLRAWLHR